MKWLTNWILMVTFFACVGGLMHMYHWHSMERLQRDHFVELQGKMIEMQTDLAIAKMRYDREPRLRMAGGK